MVMKINWVKTILILAAVCLTFYASFQYFFSIDHVIGGDGPAHVIQAKYFLSFVSSNYNPVFFHRMSFPARYPLPNLFFALFNLIFRLDWERAFQFMMCLYLFLASLALGFLSWKLFDWRTGALAMIFFSLSPPRMNSSLEDATLTQMASFGILVLLLFFLLNKKLIFSWAATVILALSHPFSFLIYLVTFIFWAIICLLFGAQDEKKFLIKYAAPILVIGILLLPWWHQLIFFVPPIQEQENDFNFLDRISNNYLPLFYLAIPGLVYYLFSKKEKKYFLFVIFVIVSFLFTFGIYFDQGYFPKRFLPYFSISLALFASVGLAKLTELVFAKQKIPSFFIIFALVYLVAADNLGHNKRLFSYYADIPSYHVLMPEEKEAFIWLKKNTPRDSVFIYVQNSHSQWLPALAEKRGIHLYRNKYFSDEEKKIILSGEDPQEIKKIAQEKQVQYLVFYKKILFTRKTLKAFPKS